jgi:uncharacterized protein (TIGR02996 family)
MSHDAPFLAQIAADPEVDAPRLIYADWLEEQQDERAEFIRVQCELAATPSPARLRVRGLAEVRGLLQGRRRLAQREKQLLARYRGKWCGSIRGQSVNVIFRRGLVDELRISAAELAAVAEGFPAYAPVLRTLQVKPNGNRGKLAQAIEALESLVWTAQLQELNVAYCDLHGCALARLLQLPCLGRLRSLDLGWNLSLGGLASDWLDGAWPLSELEVLDLRGIMLTRDAVELLIECPTLRRLRMLVISRQPRRTYRYSQRHLGEVFGEKLLAI